MNSPQSSTSTVSALTLPAGAPAAARSAFKLLARLKHGTLTLQLPGGSIQRFGSGEEPMASLHLHNWNVCGAALRSGDIGFAESYIAGDWSTPQLTDLLRLLIVNRKEVEDVIYGTWLGRLAYRLKHLLNRNTKANSQKNIHAHYDLGNAFYELWLDGTMNYSSALFETPETSMKEAQNAKVRRALRMVQVQPGERVLEIGCGWGALAEMATTEFGASLVGVTLSTEQLQWAQARMARAGVPAVGEPGVRRRLRPALPRGGSSAAACRSATASRRAGAGSWGRSTRCSRTRCGPATRPSPRPSRSRSSDTSR
jgi:cyclopropane-fatty-acyl-phospholipid synthase